MEKIRLSRKEKAVFRHIVCGRGSSVYGRLDKYEYASAVRNLERHNLVRGAYEEGGIVVDAGVTNFGKDYLNANPHLHNPINWTLIIASISAIAAIAALFIACSK